MFKPQGLGASKKKTPNISQTAKTKLEIKPKTKQKPTENVTKASQPTLAGVLNSSVLVIFSHSC
jgi:hypothetical protein